MMPCWLVLEPQRKGGETPAWPLAFDTTACDSARSATHNFSHGTFLQLRTIWREVMLKASDAWPNLCLNGALQDFKLKT